MFYVYQYVDPRNNEPFYIGKGTNDRKLDHLKETIDTTINVRKYYKIQSIKSEGFEPIIQELATFENEEDAYILEYQLIQKYGRKGIDKNGILMNLTLGCNPPSHKGKKWWNDGIKQKQSIDSPGQGWVLGTLSKGKTWWTNGTVDKQSVECPGIGWYAGRQKMKSHTPWNKGLTGTQVPWNKGLTGITGNKHTDESKRKLREYNLGKKKSKETKDKMSKNMKGRTPWNKDKSLPTPGNVKPCCFISPEGIEYKYPSMRQGCLFHKLAICKMSNVRTGKLSNYKGWTIRIDN